ncbi:MAG TPA: sporulation membrane protein YtaF [Firmicutes bacterium]|nr:sporulation membrane protein YtaF [Bacillota bacterium]
MESWYASFFQIILLVTALSVDAFVASLAYGASNIRIPPISVVVITLVCSLILGISLLFGSLIRPFVPAQLTKIICCAVLMILGFVKLCDSSMKHYIRKHCSNHKEISFSALHLKFILNIYADPVEADSDQSHTLSPKEAGSLATALSLDGLAAGFGAALGNVHLLQALFCSIFVNALAVLLGSSIGNRIAQKASLDLSWLSGVMLIALALLKLV